MDYEQDLRRAPKLRGREVLRASRPLSVAPGRRAQGPVRQFTQRRRHYAARVLQAMCPGGLGACATSTVMAFRHTLVCLCHDPLRRLSKDAGLPCSWRSGKQVRVVSALRAQYLSV